MNPTTPLLAVVPLTHLIIEFAVYLVFIWRMYDAWLHARRYFWASFSFAGFALILESVSDLVTGMSQGHMSQGSMIYGPFLVMLPGRFPLWIVLGWVVLMSTAMRNTELLKGSFLTWPLITGLLAMTFSLSLDPVAVFDGWYTFDPGIRSNGGPYFGVPPDHALLYFGCGYIQSCLLWAGWKHFSSHTSAWVQNLVVPLAAAGGALVLVIVYALGLASLYTLADVDGKPWMGQQIMFCVMLGAILTLLFLWRTGWSLNNPSSWNSFLFPKIFFPLLVLICVLKNAYHTNSAMPIAVLCDALLSSLVWAAPCIWFTKKVPVNVGVRTEGSARSAGLLRGG